MTSITILTLFPELFPGPLGASNLGKGLEKGLWNLRVISLRDFAPDPHKTVDDTAYGGGAGMVMRPDVIARALDAALSFQKDQKKVRLFYLSPRGIPICQQHLSTWSKVQDDLIILCGRFEGVDQRVIDVYELEEISLGDFILMGGETAAMAIVEGYVRLVPGIIGNQDSLCEESFADHLLEYPQYTRPAVWKESPVPEILRSGHHAQIKGWRRQEAEKITKQRRPDLWTKYQKRDM